ncbi:MAG: hypothetical protein SFY69_12555 [Planctomycetota bacterium]|nr:hypothetical protein [Planctomycetota bacterium]
MTETDQPRPAGASDAAPGTPGAPAAPGVDPSADPDYGKKYRQPPFVRRLRWWWLLTVLPVPVWVWIWPGPGGWAGPLVFFLPQFVVIFVLTVVYRRARGRAKRVVDASDGRACWHCVYDLSGLPEIGACPECGRAYEHAEVQRRWKAADW